RKLDEAFLAIFGPAAGGRRVRARLEHDAEVPPGAATRPWPLRFTDVDPLRHANNAIYLAMVEEVLAGRDDLRSPRRVEVEFREGIEPGAQVVLASAERGDGSLALWVVDDRDDRLYATATVAPLDVS